MSMISTTNLIYPDEGRIDKVLKDGTVKVNAGCTSKGYRYISIGNKRKPVHRVIWEYVNGSIPESKEIDHIDGNPLNNKIGNLRLVTHIQNCQNKNRPTGKNKTSGVKGVHWDKARDKWRTHIVVNGKQFHIGRFDDINDAKNAYNKAASELHTHNPHAGLST